MVSHSPGSSTEMTSERGIDVVSLVVCSLESWSTVRRRIRILVDELVDRDEELHVLFVGPAVDIPHRLRHGEAPFSPEPRLSQVHPRIHVLRPRKWLPRVVGGFADRSLERQVLDAVSHLGLRQPLLWINNSDYAGLSLRTGWPTLYDITDDWQRSPRTPRQLSRLVTNEDLLLARADSVVVCSPDLARTRGRTRPVELIPNGVDVALFRSPRTRPTALPTGPVVLYAGSLHTDRLDVPLVEELAAARPDVHVVLVGPNSLPAAITQELERIPNLTLLGACPYEQVPAFMQHADVIVIPHLVNPFTESLDPIKAYECLAVARPTVATPVAGFRSLGSPVVVADRADFVRAVDAALATAPLPGRTGSLGDVPLPTWRDRADTLATVMTQIRARAVR